MDLYFLVLVQLLLTSSCFSQTAISSYFSRMDFYELDGNVIRLERVYDDFDCIWRCNIVSECKSVNYAYSQDGDGLHKCILLKSGKLELLKSSYNYHYYYKYKDCPEGWQTYKGSTSCYRAIKKQSNWNDARKLCLALESDLAVIKSEKENAFVAKLAEKEGSGFVWIGLHRDASKAFKWVDGSLLSGQYKKWSTGEPSDVKEECGMMYLNKNYFWNDHTCSVTASHYVFVCEQNISVPLL